MSKLVLRPAAEADLADALAFYEARRPGLGAEFLAEVEAVLETIGRLPETGPLVHGEIRRHLIRRFPFGVFYVVEPDGVVVLAVFHARVDPRRWGERG